jgi:hypothetical protein
MTRNSRNFHNRRPLVLTVKSWSKPCADCRRLPAVAEGRCRPCLVLHIVARKDGKRIVPKVAKRAMRDWQRPPGGR